MEGRAIATLLSYHCLTGAVVFFLAIMMSVFAIFSYFSKLYHVEGPLVHNPDSSFERAVNKFRVKFRTYIVEYDVEDGAIMIPNMFTNDFGDQVQRFATLIDTKSN